MFRTSLLASVATAALIASAPSAFAQTAVSQTATNSSVVDNAGTENIATSTFGLGASVAVGATGALTSTSVTGLNQAFDDPIDGFANVTQKSTNNSAANVTNDGAINIGTGSKTGAGSSVSISANGALASFSVAGVGGNSTKAFTAPVAGNTKQTSENTADITNKFQPALNGLTLTGNGSSVSANAGGSFASVSVSGINADTFTMGNYGSINQTSTNGTSAPVQNLMFDAIETGNLDGAGTSVSTGASGATAAVGATFINVGTLTGSSIGNITQSSENGSDVTNTLSTFGANITTTKLHGNGTSVSTNASGAVASVGFTNIDVDATAKAVTLGNINQTATNKGAGTDITNGANSTSITTGNLEGDGASVSSSATGAVAAVGFSNIDSTYRGVLGGNNITQNADNQGGTVRNEIATLSVGFVTGDGAAVSGSATGALASVSFGAVGSTATAGFDVGNTKQTSTNNALVNNRVPTITTSGSLTGAGTSVSTGASGAVASTAISHIASTAKNSTLGSVTQTATNKSGGDVENQPSTLTVGGGGDLMGNGSSASVSANGSLAAISLSSINSVMAKTTLGAVNQTSENSGVVDNDNGIINVDALSGVGTSAVVSATGAAASLSVASIADTTLGSVDINGSITQSATNNAGANVSNLGTITTGILTGAGASVSISAVGAGAFASFHSVK